MKKPDFFIVGAPKCGTTAMYEYLKQHPEIFMPEDVKEPNYFGSDMNCLTPRLTLEQYLALFSKVKNEKRIGEASVLYLHTKRAAVEIKDFCPTARIIIMLRNPVDMLYSYHSDLVYLGSETISDFKTAMDKEEFRKKTRPRTVDYLPYECLFYRDMATFSEQVQRFFEVFDRENVHIILFDDFISDTAKIYKETLRFLGVQDNFQPTFNIVNPSKQIRGKFIHQFLHYSPMILRRLARIVMKDVTRSKIRQGLKRLNTRRGNPKPIDAKLKETIQAEFIPEVKRLSKLIGRDLQHWMGSTQRQMVNQRRR